MSQDPFNQLLSKFVNEDGFIDYGGWQSSPADVTALDHYLGSVTRNTPDTRPEKFADSSARMSYWINLYNALVIREVVRRWPLDSVRDVKVSATSRVFKGKGFFRDLTFQVGDTSMSLDDIENKVLRQRFKDARVHFAINCASASCPIIRPGAYDGNTLESQLLESTQDFLEAPENVSVDDDAKVVRLSKLFKWYEDDFKAHAKELISANKPTVLGFIHYYASSPLRQHIARAQEGRYSIEYRDYDWGVNAGTAPTHPPYQTP